MPYNEKKRDYMGGKMKLNEYQEKAQSFDLTRDGSLYNWRMHSMFQLLEEAGELAGVYKRLERGDYPPSEVEAKVKDELCDIIWAISAVAASHGFTLEQIALHNIAKLEDRKARGVIKGKGDTR